MSRFNHVSFFRRWTVAVPTTSAVGVSLLAVLAGCSSGPSRVAPPRISASGAASGAMELYDKDGDGFIAGAELDAAGPLKASMATLDLDKDGKVSEDEIVKRVETWQSTSVGITSVDCRITMDGKPVEGAKVTFEPEPYLGDGLKTAIGETIANGVCSPSIPKQDRPSPDWPSGIQYGLFKVRVSKQVNGAETIPTKYNTETILGQQISFDDPALKSQLVKIDMTSK